MPGARRCRRRSAKIMTSKRAFPSNCSRQGSRHLGRSLAHNVPEPATDHRRDSPGADATTEPEDIEIPRRKRLVALRCSIDSSAVVSRMFLESEFGGRGWRVSGARTSRRRLTRPGTGTGYRVVVPRTWSRSSKRHPDFVWRSDVYAGIGRTVRGTDGVAGCSLCRVRIPDRFPRHRVSPNRLWS